jgi:hypothetical protein
MSSYPHLSLRLVRAVAVVGYFAAAACGDDDGSGGDGTGGTGGENEAGNGARSGNGGSGGSSPAAGGGGTAGGTTGPMTGAGDRPEGAPCNSVADCESSLACVLMEIPDGRVRVCARGCTDAAECTEGERCESPFTDLPADRHCINYKADPYDECGVADTSLCADPRECLYFEGEGYGLCVNYCQTDPTEDAGIPNIPAMCPDNLTCLTGLVQNDAIGLCGTPAARDAECGLETGRFCDTTADICIPDDLMDPMSAQHCREDCTRTNMCTGGGTCTMVNRTLYYCKK